VSRKIAAFIHFVWKTIGSIVLILVCTCLAFIGYKANQPMSVTDAPQDITYAEFIHDRIDAAKTVKPSQCGWGMMLSLAVFGPVYSIVYTSVGVNPDGFLAKVTAPDPDIPKNVVGARWNEVPGIWWSVVEHLSWTLLGEQHKFGCQFRTVKSN
jgi:hypothetical protein